MSPEKTPAARTRASAPAKSAEPPEVLDVGMNAMAGTRVTVLNATQSAIGSATVDGDASMTTSAVGMVSAKGSASLAQGCAGAVVSEGDVAVRQAGGAVIVGKSIDVDQGGSCVMVSGETNASRSYVGVLLSRKASFSEDSRVLFDWKAALILAGVLLGGVGLLIVAGVVIARMVMGRVHRLTERLPHLPSVHIPEIPPWMVAVARRIRAA